MSPARLARFSATVGGDKQRGLRLYVWNARLCEEFYLPLQIAEISVRNAIHNTLIRRFGDAWYSDVSFTAQLTQRYQEEIRKIVASERAAKGAAFTVDHVVAGMTFGFWVHLLTARYDNILWQGGVKRSFPHIERKVSRENVHTKIDQLRNFRNKVAHHFAIFDRRPTAEYQNLLEIVGFICPETTWLIRQLSNPSRVIGNRPRL